MAAPTALDVALFLGRDGDTKVLVLAGEHLPVVTEFVRAYTRDRGFDPDTGEPAPDVAAVIVSAAARLVENPANVTASAIGPFSERPGTLEGWTLPELAVLHRHRRRVA